MDFIIRENIIPFTNINLALFTLCYFKPHGNYINYNNLYSICYCWNHIIFFTFNSYIMKIELYDFLKNCSTLFTFFFIS